PVPVRLRGPVPAQRPGERHAGLGDRRGTEAAGPLGAAAGEPAVCGRPGGAGALVSAGGGGGISVLRLLCAHGESGDQRHHRGPVRVVFAAVRALIPGRSGAGPAAGGVALILVVGGLGAGKRKFIREELGYAPEQLSSVPEEGTPVLWGLEALDPLPPLEDLLGRE